MDEVIAEAGHRVNEKKKLLSHASLVLLATGIVQGSQLVLRLLIGDRWGDLDLGLYSMAITLGFFFTTIFGLGIPQGLVKFVAENAGNQHSQRNFISTALFSSLFLGVLTASMLFPFAGPLGRLFKMPDLPGLIRIALVGLPFFFCFQTGLGALNGLRRMRHYSFQNSFNSIAMLSLTILAMLHGLPIRYAVLMTVVAAILSSFWTLGLLRDYFVFPAWPHFRSIFGTLTRFSIKLMAANSVNLVNTRVDLLLVGYFLGETAVGHYSITTMLARVLILIGGAIQTVTYPVTAEYFGANKREEAARLIQKSAYFSFFILSVLGILLVFYAEQLIRAYNLDFLPAVMPTKILTACVIFYGAAGSIGGSFASFGRPKVALKLSALSAATNVVLNMILIPALGLEGAALATGLSLFVVALLYVPVLRRVMDVHFELGSFGKILAFALLLYALLATLSMVINTWVAAALVCVISAMVFLRVFAPAGSRRELSIRSLFALRNQH